MAESFHWKTSRITNKIKQALKDKAQRDEPEARGTGPLNRHGKPQLPVGQHDVDIPLAAPETPADAHLLAGFQAKAPSELDDGLLELGPAASGRGASCPPLSSCAGRASRKAM